MGRYFYLHLGDGIPRNIEREYNRMCRKEQYLKERDAQYLVRDVDFEDIMALHPDPASLPVSEYEVAQNQKHEQRLAYLPIAMELLRVDYPEGYALIKAYFYGHKVSLSELAEKHGITIETVRHRMRTAKSMLREYIILHEKH